MNAAVSINVPAQVPCSVSPKKYTRSPHANEYKSGRSRGPRRLRRLIARVPEPVAEMLAALFDLQRKDDDDPQHPLPVASSRELHAGEVIESYIIDSAKLIFGLSYFEYAKRRDKGERINLRALFGLRHAELMGGVQ